jgi:FixJ family two-component response regulator
VTDRQPAKAGRPTILLVEAEPAVRRSLQLVLEGSGFAVRSYALGAALLADPCAASAMGLVADCLLPDSSGWAVLRALRTAGFTGRAILLTAHPSRELAIRAREEGFMRVLQKPLADRVLREAVADLST